MNTTVMQPLRPRLPIILSLLAGLVLLGGLAAQPPREQDRSNDLLDEVRRREQVAAQKVEADVRQ
ncbi:MAG TPA: hypothetical protein VGY58_10490, partial [Gemmataceae bacterium]|nr:hypothetical protein [Gemmataceae bacterium]